MSTTKKCLISAVVGSILTITVAVVLAIFVLPIFIGEVNTVKLYTSKHFIKYENDNGNSSFKIEDANKTPVNSIVNSVVNFASNVTKSVTDSSLGDKIEESMDKVVDAIEELK